MFALSGLARAAFIVLSLGLAAGCSQTTTGSSSFSGTLDANQRQGKILAARKKAKTDRAARKAEFLEKRKLKRKVKGKEEGREEGKQMGTHCLLPLSLLLSCLLPLSTFRTCYLSSPIRRPRERER